MVASWNESPAPSSILEPESVPDSIQTPKRIRIRCQYLLPPTRPGRSPTSLSESVAVDPSKLRLGELAFERHRI